MKTRSRIQHIGVFAAVALAALSHVAAAQEVSAPLVYVRLGVGEAGFSAEVLHAAEAQVTRIYRQVGINIVWISDRENDAAMAPRVPGPVLHVLIRSTAAAVGLHRSDSAVGMAPGSGSGRGNTAFIFSSGVQHAAQIHPVGLAHVLAMAIAHEVGHLLLPAGHSNAGLMRANWDVLDFALAGRGLLLFTAQQGELMRTRLQQRQEK